MDPVNFRMKGDVEGLPLNLQLPPGLRQGRAGDPFSILRPALRDLAQVDSMRILSAIDDLIWRVDIITALDQITRNVKVMATFLGDTLVSLVDRHQQVVGTLGDLKARSEIIDKLTSFQLMEAYFKNPMMSYKSIDLSDLDLGSMESLTRLTAAGGVEGSTEEVEKEEWTAENIPWGEKLEFEPSLTDSSTGTIAQIKRQMREDDDAALGGISSKPGDDDDEDDDAFMSLKSSVSRINLLDSHEGDKTQDWTEGGHSDSMGKLVGRTVSSPKLEYVQAIEELSSPDALESQHSIALAGGDSLTRTVSQPWASVQDLDTSSISTQIDELLQVKTLRMSLRLVEHQLTMLVRNILRAFRLNQVAIDMIVANKQRTEPAQELVILLKDLRQMMFQRLLTTPAEEKAKVEHMKEVERRTGGYDRLRDRLADEIEKVNRDKENKCREMNDMLRKLQLDIMTVDKLAEEYIQRTRQEGEKLCQAELKVSQERRQKSLQEQIEHTARLAKLRDEHWDSEAVLRRKKYKVETEIENWIRSFDEDMTALQIEFDEVEAAYNVEKLAMEEMEDKYEPMEAAFKDILEERDKLYRIRVVKEREDLRRLRSARSIQAWWRSFRVRKAIRIRNQKLEKQRLRELKKKGKKGKKGKKSAGGEQKKPDKK